MAKYRKKPVVIEATQWFKNGDHPDDRFDATYEAAGGEDAPEPRGRQAMIWNDEKYKLAIEALGDMTWPVCGLRDKHIFQNYLGDWVSRQVDESGCLEVGGIRRPTPHVLSDFEAMCILAEFAVRWLAERDVSLVLRSNVSYQVNKASNWLQTDGSWSVGDTCDAKFASAAEFADRHEALAEAMLAVLRETKDK